MEWHHLSVSKRSAWGSSSPSTSYQACRYPSSNVFNVYRWQALHSSICSVSSHFKIKYTFILYIYLYSYMFVLDLLSFYILRQFLMIRNHPHFATKCFFDCCACVRDCRHPGALHAVFLLSSVSHQLSQSPFPPLLDFSPSRTAHLNRYHQYKYLMCERVSFRHLF